MKDKITTKEERNFKEVEAKSKYFHNKDKGCIVVYSFLYKAWNDRRDIEMWEWGC